MRIVVFDSPIRSNQGEPNPRRVNTKTYRTNNQIQCTITYLNTNTSDSWVIFIVPNINLQSNNRFVVANYSGRFITLHKPT